MMSHLLGAGGDDFVHDFEVLWTNRLFNPNVDLDLASWIPVSPDPADVVHDATDADALDTSGSVHDCSGGVTGLQATVPAAADTGGNWLTLAANLRTPAPANSVLVSFVVLPDAPSWAGVR